MLTKQPSHISFLIILYSPKVRAVRQDVRLRGSGRGVAEPADGDDAVHGEGPDNRGHGHVRGEAEGELDIRLSGPGTGKNI